MKGPEAERIINEQVKKCLDILVVKAGEYAAVAGRGERET